LSNWTKSSHFDKEEIGKKIEEDWQSAKSGEFLDGDEVFDRIEAEPEAMQRSTPK